MLCGICYPCTPLPEAFESARRELTEQLAEAWKRAGSSDSGGIEGFSLARKWTAGRRSPVVALRVAVRRKLPRSRLASGTLIPPSVAGLLTDVVEQPVVSPQWGASQHNQPSWPVVGGTNVGPESADKCGTAACVVTDAAGSYFVLTCAHVVSRGGMPGVGERVLQPGLRTSGIAASQTLPIGRVSHCSPIVLDSRGPHAPPPAEIPNAVDIALIAVEPPKDYQRELYPRLTLPPHPGVLGIGEHPLTIAPTAIAYPGVTLEDDVFLGPSCVFTNVSNPRSAVNRRHLYERTTVGRGATIGANATVVCGHDIGVHAFVAAGAVVTGDVPPYAMMVGVPARQVGWMSRHGHVLAKAGAPDGTYTCTESKLRYALEGGVMRCLDVPDDAPLPPELAVGTKSYREF